MATTDKNLAVERYVAKSTSTQLSSSSAGPFVFAPILFTTYVYVLTRLELKTIEKSSKAAKHSRQHFTQMRDELQERQRHLAQERDDFESRKAEYDQQEIDDGQTLQEELDERLCELTGERDALELAKQTHDADVRDQEARIAEARAELGIEKTKPVTRRREFDCEKQMHYNDVNHQQAQSARDQADLKASLEQLAHRQEQFEEYVHNKIAGLETTQTNLHEMQHNFEYRHKNFEINVREKETNIQRQVAMVQEVSKVDDDEQDETENMLSNWLLHSITVRPTLIDPETRIAAEGARGFNYESRPTSPLIQGALDDTLVRYTARVARGEIRQLTDFEQRNVQAAEDWKVQAVGQVL